MTQSSSSTHALRDSKRLAQPCRRYSNQPERPLRVDSNNEISDAADIIDMDSQTAAAGTTGTATSTGTESDSVADADADAELTLISIISPVSRTRCTTASLRGDQRRRSGLSAPPKSLTTWAPTAVGISDT